MSWIWYPQVRCDVNHTKWGERGMETSATWTIWNGGKGMWKPCHKEHLCFGCWCCGYMIFMGVRWTVVMHQTCLVLWTWRKLADETNAKNAPKICWKIVLTWGIQTALAIRITQSQDYPYVKDEYKLVIAIYHTRMTILEQEMTANV